MSQFSFVARSRLALAVLLLSLALAGCGGGGGGGGGSSSGGSSSSGGGSSGGGGTGTLALQLSTTAVNFNAYGPNFGQPANESVFATISGTGSGTLYIVITPSDPAVATVTDITASANSGTAQIVPGSASALGLGAHTATITVKVCVNNSTCSSNQIIGSPQTITVNYTVSGLSTTESALSYSIGNASTTADLSKAFIIGNYPAEGWTATTDIPFLNVTPSTGGTTQSTPMTAAIDAALLDVYGGGEFTGRIHIQPGGAGQVPLDVPVTMNIRRTRVNIVAPHVAVAGKSEEVIIRGEAFSAAPPTGVLFGSTPASTYTVVSDTEIRATHPALAAGSYTVHVANAQGIDRTTAELHVIAPAALPATEIQYPDGAGVIPFALIYDAQRSALLANIVYNEVGTETNQLVRYARSGGTWQQTTRIFIPYRSAMALSADGRTLLLAHAGANGLEVDERDPVTLAVLHTSSNPTISHEALSMAVSNDGTALIEEGSSNSSTVFHELLYSPWRRTVSNMIRPGPIVTEPPMLVDAGPTAASGDGSLVVFSDAYLGHMVRYVSGSPQGEFYDTEQGSRTFSDLRINRRGTLLVMQENGVYDANLDRVGMLPQGSYNFAVAPTQPRVYTLDSNDDIRRFDTDAPAVNGMLQEILPAITPVAAPNGVFGVVPMVVSPDELTLFVAGRDRIVVQPLP